MCSVFRQSGRLEFGQRPKSGRTRKGTKGNCPHTKLVRYWDVHCFNEKLYLLTETKSSASVSTTISLLSTLCRGSESITHDLLRSRLPEAIESALQVHTYLKKIWKSRLSTKLEQFLSNNQAFFLVCPLKVAHKL